MDYKGKYTIENGYVEIIVDYEEIETGLINATTNREKWEKEGFHHRNKGVLLDTKSSIYDTEKEAIEALIEELEFSLQYNKTRLEEIENEII